MDLLNDATQVDKELREAILNAMIDNNIQTAHIGKYTISQVVPKSTITFDYESFKSENANILPDYSTTTETESFDMDLLKSKYPDIYNEIRKVNKVTVVDTKKLEKSIPTLFQKYATEIKSDKKITLAIKTKKRRVSKC